ncbi:MAG: hypothetical protein Q9209_005479 [Squamulea sp. 1 TL-2023]
MPRISGMDCLKTELMSFESVEKIRDQVLERLATSNLKAIEAYIAHHPADEEAKVIQLNSSLILSEIKSGKNLSWPTAVISDAGAQLLDTQEDPFETPNVRHIKVIKRAPAAAAMDFLPVNGRMLFTLLVMGTVIGLVVDFQLNALQSFLYKNAISLV